MSNLTSSNCGCGNSNGIFGGNCIWILLLLFCSGGNGCGCGNGCGSGFSLMNGDNNSCDWLIWILLISCICGGNGCGSTYGGGCGSNNNNCGCNSCS